MFHQLLWVTLGICVVSMVYAYASTRDAFHPAVIFAPLCAFIYWYMPWSLEREQTLFSYISEAQAEFGQWLAIAGILALMIGCFVGAAKAPREGLRSRLCDWQVLQKGGMILGSVGMICWVIGVRAAGGFTAAYAKGYQGGAYSDYAYIREAAYLLVVALILLLTPDVIQHRNATWRIALIVFAFPWLAQGLLTARRGPTAVIALTLAMSWYLARRKRPSLPLLAAGSVGLGLLMLFLVSNRDKIYLGSDFSGMRTDVVSGVTEGSEANEYIFGTACIITAEQTHHFYWGKRYLAQVVVRPIPHQLWPDKYEDFGVPELLQNAGVAGEGLEVIMGWKEVPGAAAAMIADTWVEFYWLFIPVLFFVGYAYGYVWKRAVTEGARWNSLYTIFAVLAVYWVTQSGEAVIFRLIILTVPTLWVWKKAEFDVPALL